MGDLTRGETAPAAPATSSHVQIPDVDQNPRGIETGPTNVGVYASPHARDMTIPETQAQLEAIQHSLDALVREVQQVIVGQDEVLRSILTCLLAGGTACLRACPASARR